jgi:hypothetical protein
MQMAVDPVGQHDTSGGRKSTSNLGFPMGHQICIHNLFPCWAEINLTETLQRVVQFSELDLFPISDVSAKILIFGCNIGVFQAALRLQDEPVACGAFDGFAQSADFKMATSKFFIFLMHLLYVFLPVGLPSESSKLQVIYKQAKPISLVVVALLWVNTVAGIAIIVLPPIAESPPQMMLWLEASADTCSLAA